MDIEGEDESTYEREEEGGRPLPSIPALIQIHHSHIRGVDAQWNHCSEQLLSPNGPLPVEVTSRQTQHEHTHSSSDSIPYERGEEHSLVVWMGDDEEKTRRRREEGREGTREEVVPEEREEEEKEEREREGERKEIQQRGEDGEEEEGKQHHCEFSASFFCSTRDSIDRRTSSND